MKMLSFRSSWLVASFLFGANVSIASPGGPDVQSITATIYEGGYNNAPYPFAYYDVRFRVSASNVTSVAFFDPSGGGPYGLTELHPGVFEGGVLLSTAPGWPWPPPAVGTYRILVQGPLGNDEAQVLINPVTRSQGFAEVIWPIPGSGEYDTPLRPVVVWEDASSLGDFIDITTWDFGTQTRSIGTCSWMAPASMLSSLSFPDIQFYLVVRSAMETSMETTLLWSDMFTLEQGYGHSNQILLQLCPGDLEDVPVFATLGPSGPGVGDPPQIGFLELDTFPSPTPSVGMAIGHDLLVSFELLPEYASLRPDYEFRWINVVTGIFDHGSTCQCSGCCGPLSNVPELGDLPAIEPVAGTALQTDMGPPPVHDDEPFFWNEWWFDNRAGTLEVDPDSATSPCSWTGSPVCNGGVIPNAADYAQYTLHTYLVAESDVDPAFAGDTIQVLAGFEWVADNYADQACFMEEIDPTDVDTLRAAIDNSVFHSEVNNFASWTVLDPPTPIPSFCDDEDGALDSCPCANPGDPDTGCDIPQATGGVGLAVLAQETSPNGATLQGTGFSTMSSPTAIVIRSSLPNLPAPIVFGDGILCLDDAAGLVRLAATAATSGASTHAFGNGAMAGAGTKHYQLWFRSTPSTFCDASAAFNLSNGRSLVW